MASRSGRRSASSNGPSPADETPGGAPVGGFALAGKSDLPDPATHAFRQDLADIALAGRVIASHYAEPLLRHLVTDAMLRAAPDAAADVVAKLKRGEALAMLDCSRGWAWGYAKDGRVGYVEAAAVGI